MTKSVFGARISPRTISITFSDGTVAIIANDHPNFEKIQRQIQYGASDAGIWEMCQPAEGIKSYFKGRLEVKNGGIFYKDTPINTGIVPTILQHIQEGVEPTSLLRFLFRLQKNPSQHSRDQLWNFVEKNGITLYDGPPVTVTHTHNDGEDWQELSEPEVIDATGYLVLYKGVNNNLTACTGGKFMNAPGTSLSMPRKGVDDDQSRHCSNGFHAGDFQYVQSFGRRKLIVLVDPKDVVSVPNDCYTKIRTCKYIVLEEVDAEQFEKVVGSTYDGSSYFVVTFNDGDDIEEVEIIADSLEEATQIFNDEYYSEEILSVEKIRG